MLSWSSNEEGTTADQLPQSAALIEFTEAIAGHDDDRLDAARTRLVATAGESFMVDAAAVAANFEMMTRLADGTGSLLA